MPVTDAWGIDSAYFDALGGYHEITPEIHHRVLAGMGLHPDEQPSWPRFRVVRDGDAVAGPGLLRLEDGREISLDEGDATVPPHGYHHLEHPDGTVEFVIAAPAACYLPDGRRWGWAVQLYAVRSRESWGMGDLEDLRTLGAWSFHTGARLILTNPVNAAMPFAGQDPSPYYPSSRRFRNPLYLRVTPAMGLAPDRYAAYRERGQALNAERTIRRPDVFRLKEEALREAWAGGQGPHRPELEAWLRDRPEAVTFGLFNSLARHFGAGWRGWPSEYRRPHGAAAQEWARAHRDDVLFEAWLQMLLQEQVDAAGREQCIVQDLPIGFDPSGADAWEWQDLLANGVSVGAPPDELNTLGQDWGIPPFVPWRLAAAEFRPFIESVRAGLARGGGLRIDHVMGLFRLFWIPHGAGAAEGAYVRYPAEALLAILALESERAGAFVIGEDLGTVEEGVRERLRAARIPGYRVFWFEDDDPEHWDASAMAAVTTHDLPTLAGLWDGSDLEAQERLGLQPNRESMALMQHRLRVLNSQPETASLREVMVATHQHLARSPALFATLTLEDALLVRERPNMPGTTTAWPNWSLALPVPLETILEDQDVAGLAALMSQERPAPARAPLED